ncbi:putative glutathione S-transferase GST-6.0 [Rhexocercosporidium sp. MPI-PUGE-AT-0058]|nr:putative glutathione S-transferase GST-6.0 [Rhexocercosporidium sp. MPI-PUGE-AT-0058]
MSKIQFYYAPGACSILPHILLHESGLPFSAIEVHRFDRDSGWPADYKRINPKMQVPALSIDDENITENIAVCTAISNLVPEKHLMGKSPMETIRVYEWLSWLAINLHTGGFGHVFRPYRWSDDETAHEGIKAKALQRVKGIFEDIEGRLTGVNAVGGGFTAVDAYLFAFYRWGVEVKLDMKEKYPRYTALVEHLVKRDGAKGAIKAEGIEGTW